MQKIRRSMEYANATADVTNSNYKTMLRCYTRENLPFIHFVLLQALHVEIKKKNPNLQVTLLRPKVWERVPTSKKGVGTSFPSHYTPAYQTYLRRFNWQWRSQSKNLGGAKIQILGQQQYFVLETASQSTKWPDMLKNFGRAWPPCAPGYAYGLMW